MPMRSAAAATARAEAEPDKTRVDATDSFEQWHAVTCRNYSGSELARDEDAPFAAHIEMRPFGALGLSDVWSNAGAAKLLREAAHVRRDQRDHFMLFHVTAGEIGVDQDGRQAVARAGDFFVYDQTRPVNLDFAPVYRAWMLSIPRPMLDARVGGTRRFTARRIAGTSKLGALANSVIGQLDGFGPETRPDIIDRIATSTLDILATAIAAEAQGTLPGAATEHRLLDAAKAFLQENLHEPALDIAAISRALGTSPRSLSRAFAREGTTPMRWLWRQRLQACNAALAEGRARNVTEAAFTYGFTDLSHFSRAFRKAFGRPPGSVRRR
jgi:AraC-like DNA-binding protein